MIHYKLKGSNGWRRVNNEGVRLTVGQLKSKIMSNEKFTHCDLILTDAQSKLCYTNEEDLIPIESAVFVCKCFL